MQLVKNGKTKDVYRLENGHFLLKFKDSVTGGPGGVVDPGGNLVVGEQAGMGRACLAMTAFIFERVAGEGIVDTHMVAVDLEQAAMEVLPARPFGHGLEIVTRFIATGSFVRRFGLYVQDGHQFAEPLVEITLKDDDRGDPLANDEILLALNLCRPEELSAIKEKARHIAGLVARLGLAAGLTIRDLKMEFGRAEDGRLLLIDEISPGSMRAFEGSRRVEGPALARQFTGGR